MASSKSSKGEQPKPKPEKAAPTLLQTGLLYLTLIGIGVILGYGLFFTLSHSRCSDILDNVERSHNETRQEMQNKLIQLMQDHQDCIQDTSKQEELMQLKMKIEEQTNTMDEVVKTNALRTEHKELVEELEEKLTTQYRTARESLQKRTSEVRELKKEKAACLTQLRELQHSKENQEL